MLSSGNGEKHVLPLNHKEIQKTLLKSLVGACEIKIFKYFINDYICFGKMQI